MRGRGIVFAGLLSGGFHAHCTIYSRAGNSGARALAGLRGRRARKKRKERTVAKDERTDHARTGASHGDHARRAAGADYEGHGARTDHARQSPHNDHTRQSAYNDDQSFVANDDDNQGKRQPAHYRIEER